MKKIPYIEPIIDIVQLENTDIIITSGKDNEIEDNWDTENGEDGFLNEFY